MQQNIRTFVVIPSLPEELEPLRQLAYNMWWTWSPGAIDLFRRLDVDLWEEVGHSPVALLWRIGQKRLEEAARDKAYTAQLCRVADQFYIYRHGRTWYDEHYSDQQPTTIAYFSAEFGLHECLPIYSGGLGVLAGDHLKSASDLGIPLVAVGLMYRSGYFEQQLTEDGWQLEVFADHDFHQWPATPVLNDDGRPLGIEVRIGQQVLKAHIWLVHVGRVSLYLLDADIPGNPPELRTITSRLYGGDTELRIRQEVLLGIGGLRALRALGIKPSVCHMNEGHAAFLALERIREVMKDEHLSYDEAREAVTGGNVFTTHTPVPAGIDRFESSLVERHLGWMAKELGISNQDLLRLGREAHDQEHGAFCMPLLALRTAYRSNGVSALHGEVARSMWRSCWPGIPAEEVPIKHVTNGIHLQFWTSPQMAELLDQYLGPTWSDEPDDPANWKRVDDIPDTELWRVHERRRERMIAEVRMRLRNQLKRRGAPPAETRAAEEVLDPEALTIGFGRRFAPYKRATLLFRDLDRLRALVASNERPVQFIFAGKAHPADGGGKELIKEVAGVCKRPEFRRKIVFLENYDMALARKLVRGVDVWLNNPLRLHEASGTSGMKVIANGGLHLSCLDGWWPEAFDGDNGWAIGGGRLFDDLTYQDHVESESLYNLLEREIVPLFYDRSADNVPRRWVGRMKASLRTLCPTFNTHRMLKDYNHDYYQPAIARHAALTADGFALTRRLTAWKQQLRGRWHDVRIVEVWSEPADVLKVGDELPLRAKVQLGEISPDNVMVEVYYGPVSIDGEIVDGSKVPLVHTEATESGEHVFTGAVPCISSGRFGYAVRVVPEHEDLDDRYVQGLVAWG